MIYDRKRVCVARIGAAHGTSGEVRLWSFTADPLAVADYGPLESADGERFEIEALRPGKGFFIARLKGIADRSAAERLSNVELYVPRERLPEPDAADEFYHADLIGLTVVDTEGAALGRVVAVQNFGAGDLLEVLPIAGGDTVLLPFTEAVVPVVDIAGGRLVIRAPEGLFNPAPVAAEGSETQSEQDQTSPPPLSGRSIAQRSGGG
ncbi:MAG: ribosome maturation factor RimM [Rhodoplanes sp.]